MNYFKKLWRISNKKYEHGRFPTKPKAFALFLWLFVPIFLVIIVITWFNLRLVIGTLIWILFAFVIGLITIKLSKS